jgi:hypothetical protein
MNRFFYISAALATMTGLCLATFVLGKSHSSHSVESLKLNINTTINEVVARLPEENQDGVSELLQPFTQLIGSRLEQGRGDSEMLEKTAYTLQKSIQALSLQAYRADVSPFVPPLNKAQMICGEAFTLVYIGQDESHYLHAKLKINSNVSFMSPGDINQFMTDDEELEITYLEYKKNLKGPFLKYECRNRTLQLSGTGSTF